MADQTPPGFVPDGFEPDTPATFHQDNAVDAQGRTVVHPQTVGALVRNWWEGGGNPAAIGQMLPFPKALGGSGMDNPLLPSNVVKQMYAVKQQADDAWKKGDHVTAAAKYVESIIPILGPWMSKNGDQWQSGDYTGAIGGALGLATSVAGGKMVSDAIASRYPDVNHPAAQAAAQPNVLERQAVNQVADKVLAPGSVKYKGPAQFAASELLKRGASGDRAALQEWAQSGMETAGQQIDDAMQSAGTVPVQPYIDAVAKKIEALQVKGTDLPLEADRLATLRDLQQNLVGLGQQADFADITKVRDSAYQTAEKAGAYARMGDGKLGPVADAAKDFGSAIRETSLKLKPEFAQPNADYHFYKTLDDVLNPAKGRPKNLTPNQTGITGGAQTQSAVLSTFGVTGKAMAAVRLLSAKIAEAQSSPAWQLADATKKYQIAQALKEGQVSRAAMMLDTLISRGKVLARTAPAVTAASGVPGAALTQALAQGQANPQ